MNNDCWLTINFYFLEVILIMKNDILNDIKKEVLIQALKQWIMANYHPVVAEMYCQQVDDVKHFAKWLETIQKSQMS